jgi:hypothetical protein
MYITQNQQNSSVVILRVQIPAGCRQTDPI